MNWSLVIGLFRIFDNLNQGRYNVSTKKIGFTFSHKYEIIISTWRMIYVSYYCSGYFLCFSIQGRDERYLEYEVTLPYSFFHSLLSVCGFLFFWFPFPVSCVTHTRFLPSLVLIPRSLQLPTFVLFTSSTKTNSSQYYNKLG